MEATVDEVVENVKEAVSAAVVEILVLACDLEEQTLVRSNTSA